MNFTEFYINEGIDALYHATHYSQLKSMIEDNAIKLTLSYGADDWVNKGKYYYLSCSRVKYGNWAGSGYKNISRTVVLSLDGKAISTVAKIKNVDYWGKDYHKVSGFKEEQEERIMSDKPELKPIAKYVNSVHVYVQDDLPDIVKMDLLFINENAPKIGLKVYFYGKGNENAYKMQRIEKATTDVSKLFVAPDMQSGTVYAVLATYEDGKQKVYKSFTKQEAEDFVSDLSKDSPTSKYEVIHMNDVKNIKPEDSYAVRDLKNLLKVYRGEEVDPKIKYKIEDLSIRFEIDSVMADIQNERSKHPEVFNDIVKEMKKVKMRNVRQFMEYVLKTIAKRGNR